MIKTTWKRNLVLYFSIFIILLSVLSPALNTFASLERSKETFGKESGEFLKDAKEAKDILRLLEEDAEKNPKPDRNSINFVMKRLLYPGVYVNDVRDAVISKQVKKKKSWFVQDGIHACSKNSPNNLINHNCNIPNFTTGLLQNVVNPFMQDFNNAGKSSSYSVFGLGVPEGIPGGTVPVKAENRKYTYTALELFGYSLPLTSYNGEWDQVVVSNDARMLSNFGVIDKITLVGTGLWNSVKSGIGAFIENFSFNPVRWFRNIAKSYESAASSGINTYIDTSELNIIATNAWKRPRLDSSLYNVYVLSDDEVLRETARNYFTIFAKELNKKAESNEKLKEVIALNPDTALGGVKAFKYNPKMETEASKKAREKAEKKRAEDKKHNEEEKFKAESESDYFGGKYEPKYVELTEVPKPVYYTESEQLGFWEKDPGVAAVLKKAKGNNLISKMPSKYKKYKDMVKEWEEKYEPFFKAEFDASGSTIKEILEEIDAEIFVAYPHLDPKQSISRYACANPDGSIMRKSDKTVEYLYLQNNTPNSENLNPKCSSARAPIGGGLLGTGWESKKIDDTRHIDNVSGDNGIFHQINNAGINTVTAVNSFIAKITNIILNLSFSPILDKLGIDTIVSKLVDGFKNTVFFPLASLAIAIGALMVFFQLLRNGSAIQLFGSLFATLVVFVAGAAFLMNPSGTINLVDKVPSTVDNIVADALLVEKEETSYCSTGKSKDGIRSAQCNVWGAMVFEPWVHLQFGTGYDNLYAKGHIPSGSNGFKNKNEKLVGDAKVNRGGGKVEHNWALYQLSKTKAGTINEKDKSTPLGVVDKDLYRLVDLQAGPNGGEKSDTRYFEYWSGKNGNGFVAVLTFIQSLAMGIAIAGLGIAKIEVSFMFSISILFLPIMLLYGLTPKGRGKLIGYISNLGSLLLKRVFITVMLVVLLKVINLAYSKSNSLEVGALTAIFISVAFIIYRKELLELMTFNQHGQGPLGGNVGRFKDIVEKATPRAVKQGYNVVKQEVKGATAGFIGAAAGATGQKLEVNRRIAGVRKEIKGLESLMSKGKINETELERLERLRQEEESIETLMYSKESLTEEEYDGLLEKSKEIQKRILENEIKSDELMEDPEANKDEITAIAKENEKLEEEKREIAKQAAAGPRKSSSILSEAFKGSANSRHIVGRMAERKIRRQGLAGLSAYRDVRDTVLADGADKITNMDEELEYDVYKEVLSHSKNNTTKSSNGSISEHELGQLKSSPKIQKEIREIAKKRKKMIESGKYTGITPDIEDIEKVARIVDKRRGIQDVKFSITNPINTSQNRKAEIKEQADDSIRIADAKVIKDQLLDELKSREGVIEYDKKGDFIIKDKPSENLERTQEKERLTDDELKLIKKSEEVKKLREEKDIKEMESLKEEMNKNLGPKPKEKIKEEENENENETLQ